MISRIFFAELTGLLPAMIAIIIITMLFGILSNLSSAFSKTSTKKLVYLVCYGSVITILGLTVTKGIKTALSAISLLNTFLDVTAPVMLVLIAALGGTASVAVYQPLVLIFSTVIFKIINFIVIPLFYVTFVFGIIGNLSDDLKLEKFAKTSKSAAEWVLGIVFSLFITFITAQGITGASIDNLAVRGVKFALSGYVPVVGGQLKEGFDIVVASCLVIKNALGLTSIIVLVFTVILPILRLVVFMLALKITAAIIEPVSDKKFSNCLTATAKSITLLIVALIAITFAILIMFMLLIYTVNLGVI